MSSHHSEDSKGSRKNSVEILRENFGENFEDLNRRDKFTLIALLGQVGRHSNKSYSLIDAYRDLPGSNIPESLFNLLPELSINLSETALVNLIEELIKELRTES
jgi:hypothetical protein